MSQGSVLKPGGGEGNLGLLGSIDVRLHKEIIEDFHNEGVPLVAVSSHEWCGLPDLQLGFTSEGCLEVLVHIFFVVV